MEAEATRSSKPTNMDNLDYWAIDVGILRVFKNVLDQESLDTHEAGSWIEPSFPCETGRSWTLDLCTSKGQLQTKLDLPGSCRRGRNTTSRSQILAIGLEYILAWQSEIRFIE